MRTWVIAAFLVLACAIPARAAADPVPTITLDRDGPVTLLVQSKSALNLLNLAVTSPLIQPVCTDCKGGEALSLGAMSKGTEIVLRLEDAAADLPLHQPGSRADRPERRDVADRLGRRL